MPLFESNIQSLSGGTAIATGPLVSFGNSNGVSFGVSGNTITATVGTMTAGGGVDIQAGTNTITSGTVVFSSSNNVSFGLTGSTMTALAQVNVSAGTAAANLTNVVFSNSNGLSFGLNGSTITAKLPSMSFYVPPSDANSLIAMPAVSTAGLNLSLRRVTIPHAFNISRVDLLGNFSLGGSTAGSFTLSAAFFTLTGSTASLLSSSSVAYTFNSGTTNTSDQYGGYLGTRWRSIPTGGWAAPPGADFMLALMGSINGPTGTTGTMSLYCQNSFNPAAAVASGNYTEYWGDGVYSAGTGAFPSSMHISELVQTGSLAAKQAYFRLIGSGP